MRPPFLGEHLSPMEGVECQDMFYCIGDELTNFMIKYYCANLKAVIKQSVLYVVRYFSGRTSGAQGSESSLEQIS